ncbi:hypothetical protein [Subtercola endophyticus]|uniref:hypothetical protein n=1 Tax=Subtercola endophyticus TaxID=2895559 RepID=UPI001E51588C|nr:hypothetical protein [Subtercola endophyticus]UFS57647.1 hypothetical protein LQ955_11305 [Subtercola endophyticus]
MATSKQAHAIVSLARRAADPGAIHRPEQMYERVLQLSHAEVSQLFDKLNAKLGFDHALSKASPNQVWLGNSLEEELSLPPNERTHFSSLSYAEADSAIKVLLRRKRTGRGSFDSTDSEARA